MTTQLIEIRQAAAELGIEITWDDTPMDRDDWQSVKTTIKPV